MPIVGVIEPGSESAVRASKNDRIGVIATEGTIKSRAYQRAIRSLNPNALVLGRGCQRFVELFESGRTKGEEVEEIAVKCLTPLLKEGIDTLVLGCTHFHFLEDVIRKVAGESVTIVDPSFQTVEHIKDVLESNRLNRIMSEPPIHQFFTTGEIDVFKEIGENLLGKSIMNLRHVEVHEIIHARRDY
ncbi:MAG: aspartate/glutamate racemase family protein [Candidatus Bathyarchaeota archaeon]|nr:aspartate/glutamate racemase family protein [Candidatus Bathyarchaeota archaeon]